MSFEPFSPAHWAGMGFAVAVAALIVIFRSRLRHPKVDRIARIGIASFLALSDLSLYVWYTATDNWGVHALPLQLCTMTLWISAAALLTGNRILCEAGFFLGILGATQALATPNLDETFPGFRYFHFFLAHAAIVGAGVYLAAVADYRPGLRSVARAFLWLNLLAVPAAVANHFTGQNFMFLARKPDTASLLDLLAPWPWYILQLELIAAVLILVLLGIVQLADRAGKRKSKRTPAAGFH